MRAGGVFLSILIVTFCLAGIRVFGTLKAGGAFSRVETAYEQTCTRVTGISGTEDLVIDPATGIAFVSSHDRRIDMEGGEAMAENRGGVYAYDLNRPSEGFVELTAIGEDGLGPADFRPHGLSFYESPEGEKTLMVINHPLDADHTIEIYDVVEDVESLLPRLNYRLTVSGPMLKSPNDLVAIDDNRFYATNDHGSRNPWSRMIEDYLRLNIASVVYFDGEALAVALNGLTYANGIELSVDRKTAFVAETTDNRVAEYGIDSEGMLHERQRWSLGFGVDNLDRAADGSVWVGGHPKMLDFIAHAEDSRVMSPGKVVRIPADGRRAPETVFVTDGEIISGLSVAAEHNGTVVMGQVFDDGILVCE